MTGDEVDAARCTVSRRSPLVAPAGTWAAEPAADRMGKAAHELASATKSARRVSGRDMLRKARTSAPPAGRNVSRCRYLLVALLVNLPGNALLGCGGGIALSPGLSRVFQPAAMVATLAVAVSPVPLAVWTFGLSPAVAWF
jgi:hypothetical protein